MRVILGAAVAAAAVLLVPPAPAAITPLRWCGNDAVQSDRLQDRMGGEQIHVIYAIPADGADRFAELASLIATDVAAIDAWWRREDSSRAPRFDLFEFPGCESRFGKLDLSFVRLPDPASVYFETLDRFQRLATQIAGEPFVFAAPSKKIPRLLRRFGRERQDLRDGLWLCTDRRTTLVRDRVPPFELRAVARQRRRRGGCGCS